MGPSERLTILCVALAVVFFAQIIKPGRWRVAKVVTVALILLGLGRYVAYRRHEESVKAQEQARRRAELESRIADFAASYNAVQDWKGPFRSNARVYSAQLAPVLVRQDGRPILSLVLVGDVGTVEGRYIIRFTDHSNPRVNLSLDSTPEQAHLAMSDPRSRTYVVIAQIESVTQATDEGNLGETSFRAEGRCVDLMQLSAEDWFALVLPASSP